MFPRYATHTDTGMDVQKLCPCLTMPLQQLADLTEQTRKYLAEVTTCVHDGVVVSARWGDGEAKMESW